METIIPSRFNVGDIIRFDVKGEEDEYQVVSKFIEATWKHKSKSEYIYISYEARNMKTDDIVEFEDEDTIAYLSRGEKDEFIKHDEIDGMLDEHNRLMELHRFINSTDVLDTTYLKQAKDIIEKLNKAIIT